MVAELKAGELVQFLTGICRRRPGFEERDALVSIRNVQHLPALDNTGAVADQEDLEPAEIDALLDAAPQPNGLAHALAGSAVLIGRAIWVGGRHIELGTNQLIAVVPIDARQVSQVEQIAVGVVRDIDALSLTAGLTALDAVGCGFVSLGAQPVRRTAAQMADFRDVAAIIVPVALRVIGERLGIADRLSIRAKGDVLGLLTSSVPIMTMPEGDMLAPGRFGEPVERVISVAAFRIDGLTREIHGLVRLVANAGDVADRVVRIAQ